MIYLLKIREIIIKQLRKEKFLKKVKIICKTDEIILIYNKLAFF